MYLIWLNGVTAYICVHCWYNLQNEHHMLPVKKSSVVEKVKKTIKQRENVSMHSLFPSELQFLMQFTTEIWFTML